jgi:hypothetical protein
MSWLRARATYANVVSTVCLFLLLGGAAYAAGALPKNSVGTKQLKANAVTGAKVKDGSLGGADIKLSTLGQVPSASHAASADTAAHAGSADQASRSNDAATLGGIGPAGFYPATDVRRIDFSGAIPAGATILSFDGLELRAGCQEGGLAGSTLLSVSATSSQPGAQIAAQMTSRESGSEKSTVGNFELSSTPSEVAKAFTALGAGGSQAVGTLLYHDATHSIAIVLELRAISGGSCQLSGTTAGA